MLLTILIILLVLLFGYAIFDSFYGGKSKRKYDYNQQSESEENNNGLLYYLGLILSLVSFIIIILSTLGFINVLEVIHYDLILIAGLLMIIIDRISDKK